MLVRVYFVVYVLKLAFICRCNIYSIIAKVNQYAARKISWFVRLLSDYFAQIWFDFSVFSVDLSSLKLDRYPVLTLGNQICSNLITFEAVTCLSQKLF